MNKLFEKIIQLLCQRLNEHEYHVLLEADLCGWIFHLLLENPTNSLLITPSLIHQCARINVTNKKYDIAIGTVVEELGYRPRVDAKLISEVKIFPRSGFTDQQHRVHYLHILNDDLPKFHNYVDRLCYEVIFDESGYLNGLHNGTNRLNYLVYLRDNNFNHVKLIIIRANNGEFDMEIL